MVQCVLVLLFFDPLAEGAALGLRMGLLWLDLYGLNGSHLRALAWHLNDSLSMPLFYL